MEIRYKNGSLGVISGPAGEDGITPHIGENGHWYLGETDTGVSAKGPKGEDGRAFSIAKVYPSIIAMDDDHDNEDVAVGQFVMIDTNDVEDPDNAKLYVKTETGFTYVTDLSGATGLTGPAGKSAYELAVDNGFEGTEEEWLDSLSAKYTPIEGDVPLKPITGAEYAALTEEEKGSDTAWLITDDQNGSTSAGSSGASSASSGSLTYSEEETVIGTWIDGKPIYRRVVKGTSTSIADSSAPIGQGQIMVDTLVSLYGCLKVNNAKNVPINCAIGEDIVAGFFDDYVPMVYVSNEYWVNKPVVMALEYTKTTD